MVRLTQTRGDISTPANFPKFTAKPGEQDEMVFAFFRLRSSEVELAMGRAAGGGEKGYSPPAATQSFATDVKHLNHQLRHINGSRSVAQDTRVSKHELRNHVPTVLDFVKGNDRRRSARPQESIR
jgi:hypothetical protein